jgi:hypothetical protein
VALVVSLVEVSRVVSDAIVELVWEEPVAPVCVLLVAPSVSLLVVLVELGVVVVPATVEVEVWSR